MSKSVKGWTEERRQQQAQAIQGWKPWEQSTGPQSPEGKAVASRNADKGGDSPRLRRMNKMLSAYGTSFEGLQNSGIKTLDELRTFFAQRRR